MTGFDQNNWALPAGRAGILINSDGVFFSPVTNAFETVIVDKLYTIYFTYK